ncbi:MAG TPA: CRTAC1 family protein [Bryobacteraceae bacterium]|nr:CRTAC1 family protein [Bryobacteraceae bacterium]
MALTRRKRLMIKYALAGLGGVLAGSAALLVIRDRPKPYAPGEAVEGITSELSRTLPADYPRLQFRDVAAQAGVRFRHFHGKRSTQLPEDMGSGAAWGDYDNDGDWDLYLVNIAGPLTASPEQLASSPACNRLYRNNGDGTFTDVTAAAGVGFCGVGMGAAWADYDNDGHADLVVTSYDRLVLYHNRGDGTFEDTTRRAGLEKFRGFWAGASWSDYDRDGWVDLYVCGYVKYRFQPEFVGKSSKQYSEVIPFMLNPSSYRPERNLLFRNNGDGTFAEVARQAGVDNPNGRSLSAAWADFDNDGWPDLYVANDISDNVMYRNLGNGRFEDVSHAAWVADYRGAMGLAVGDYDRDGDLDLFVTHWLAQENAFYWNLRLSHANGGARGPLKFTDIADMMGLGQIALQDIGWGTSFFDYDNDGRLDLFVVNGSTLQEEADPSRLVPMKNRLFWQRNSEEGFFETSAVSGAVFSERRVGRGAAFADYDGDGDVDIVIINHGGPPLLLRNEGGNRNHWLKVRLRTSRSNRSGFGARVEVEAGGVRQIEEIGAQPSYLSQNAAEAHFGLGRQAVADRVTVRFPSGVVRELRQVPANQTVYVTE